MQVLTKEKIEKDLCFPSRFCYSLGFTVIGITLSVMPLLYLNATDTNAIIGVVFCSAFFGIPFGYYWGLRKFIIALKQKTSLNNGRFGICVDVVTDMRMLSSGVKTGTRDSYCQLQFQKYSELTSKCYTVRRKVFDKIREGDEFYLVFLKDIKDTISVFPQKSFKLSEELQNKFEA